MAFSRRAAFGVLVAVMVAAAGLRSIGLSQDVGMPWRGDVAPLFRTPAAFQGELGTLRSPLFFADGIAHPHVADWPRRRAEMLAEWHGLMGAWPPLLDTVPMEVLSETRRETYLQRRVRLQVAPGQRIEGWLLVPADCHGCGRRPCSSRSTSPRPASVSASDPIATSPGN